MLLSLEHLLSDMTVAYVVLRGVECGDVLRAEHHAAAVDSVLFLSYFTLDSRLAQVQALALIVAKLVTRI